MPAVPLTRRQGLRALAVGAPALLLAACTSDPEQAPSSTPSANEGAAAAPSADDPAATDPAADEAALIALYDAALAAPGTSDTREVLALLRDQHAAHRDALGGAADVPVPASPPSLAALIAAEKRASRARIRACVAAADPDVARLLALIAASEAAHVPVLKDVSA